MIKVYVPKDSFARALGADEVADAIAVEAAAQKLGIQIVRNGSRGLAWLEPLVEVETAKGRIAFGPVEVSDVKALVKAAFKERGKLSLGLTEELPFLKKQERLTFPGCGIYDPTSNYG